MTNYAVSKMSGVNRASLDIVIGTLRPEDSDGRENDAEKVNLRFFNFHRDYSKSLTLSNVGEPF